MLLVAESVSAAPPQQADSGGQTDTHLEASVDRVIDGSSLDAHVAGNRTAIGYLGADTPALNQRCGAEAFERNQQLAGDRVVLVSDPAYEFDALGRRLFYAFTVDGASIDETLIREGLARAVRPDAGNGVDLALIEAEAETEARGCLWASE